VSAATSLLGGSGGGETAAERKLSTGGFSRARVINRLSYGYPAKKPQ
jgi:hypothetical protein